MSNEEKEAIEAMKDMPLAKIRIMFMQAFIQKHGPVSEECGIEMRKLIKEKV